MSEASPQSGSGLLVPDSVLQNRYRITQLLGQGGMGAVYLASDARFASRTCVIKEMLDHFNDPEQRAQATESFHREADLLATFKHPGIPEVYDRFTEANRHYLVMEYINGIDLEQRLLDHGAPFSEKDVMAWAIQCCDVLSYLHHQNPPIIYRDMKPANIITTHWGKAYLVDFGIARFFNPVTRGTMIGTQGYAPPEQYRGQVDPRSDIYALGATMHYLLTCRDPQNEAPFSFPPVSSLNDQVSPEMEMLILRALDPEPENRFESADEMLGELMAIGGDETDVVRDCPHCGHRSSITRQFCPNCKQYISKKAHVLKRQEGSGVFITDAAGLHQVKAAGRTESLGGGNRSATATVLAIPTGRVDFNLRRLSPTALGLLGIGLTALTVFSVWWSTSPGAPPLLSEGQHLYRRSNTLKSEAAAAYARKDFSSSADAYRRYLEKESGDAEAQIYYHNALLQVAAVKSYNVVVAGAWSHADLAAADDFLRGAALAQQQFNERSRASFIRLSLLDDQNSTQRALSGASAITREPSIAGVVGHLSAETTRAVAPVYSMAGLPVFHPGVYSSEPEGGKGGFYRLASPESVLAEKLLAPLKGGTPPLLIADSPQEGDGSGVGAELAKLAEARGMPVTLLTRGAPSEVAESCASNRAEAVFVAGPLTRAISVNAALRRGGLKTQVWGGPEWLLQLGDGDLPVDAEGLLCAVPRFLDTNLESSRQFALLYREKFQKEPHYLAAMTYDAVTLVGTQLAALSDTANASRVGGGIKGLSVFSGLVGSLRFDETGGALRPAELWQVQNGKFRSFSP
ncbi:MAG: bifunctional serine/threonine-protein kinase/ABC transporter substrate-binding protein [Candidatus Sericytochromatia bacterium]|nr:bifunctional serine/threonine-protein kinase/ABC transporter substrate-binding protein [Candidatus Sericytochromatia bacterium]